MITPSLLRHYRQNPLQFAYDTGFSHGYNDYLWDSNKPRVFKKDDCREYRQGYRLGWAGAKAGVLHSTIDFANTKKEIDDIEEECQFWEAKELKRITELTNELAECPDAEADDGKASWLGVVDFMENFGKKEQNNVRADK